MSKRLAKSISGAVLAFTLCVSSVAATAATTPKPSIKSLSPLVALSAYGTYGSGAVCATAIQGSAALTAAAQAQTAPAPGCVLPVVDQPVAAVAQEPAVAPVYPPAESAGLGIWPILGGLAFIAGLAAIILTGDSGQLRLRRISPD